MWLRVCGLGSISCRGLARLLALLLLLLPISAFLGHPALAAGGMVIDHTCTDISQVPVEWINQARSQFRLSYGHTSHGSQIVAGMELLAADSAIYAFSWDGEGGALSLHDYEPEGDLGAPDLTTWYYRTRDLLDQRGNDRNLVMWSWCGQVSDASSSDIADSYLALMSRLERDYPGVTFVYMTGHLDGTGVAGNLNQRNNQIRQYCRANGKVLFDFADIESYNPDGVGFLAQGADDGCNYSGGNWAEQWCTVHPGACADCSCEHSQCLNCQQKGKAFWWMLARLAGWAGPGTPGATSTPTGMRPRTATPTATTPRQTATATATRPTGTPTATSVPGASATPTPPAVSGEATIVYQQGSLPNAGYTGAADVILSYDIPANANVGAVERNEVYWADVEARRSLLRWELSGIPPDAYIESAVVELYRYEGYADTDLGVAAYMVSAPWVEGSGNEFWPPESYVPDGATWTLAAPGAPWSSPGGDYDDQSDFGLGPNGMLDSFVLSQSQANGWVRLNIVAAARRWVAGSSANYGILLRPISGEWSYHYFHSGEAESVTLRPRLVVHYASSPAEQPPLRLPLILRGWKAL